MAIPAKHPAPPAAQTIEDVLIKGDLSALTPEQRTEYYMRTCQSLGLNPMTQPFSYITLNGKLVLYALRAAADQLRKINGISLEIISQDLASGLLSVHVRAKDKTGRTDEDLGVVAIGHLKGEAAANAILKAVTKAKRRVTLSISGLGYLDETEIDDLPAAAKNVPSIAAAEQAAAPKPVEVPHNAETGEVLGPHEFVVPDGQEGWKWFGAALIASLQAAATEDEFAEWLMVNHVNIVRMEAESPRYHAHLKVRIDGVRADKGFDNK